MAPRPDLPDDDPTDRSVPGGDHVSDEQWAAIVADLRGDLDPTGPDPTGADDGTAGEADPARTTSGPAVTYPVAPWVSERRVVRPARRPGPDEDEAVPPELAGARDWDATAQMDEAERRVDAEEHFVPEDPGPVLGGDPLLTMAWLAVGGIPLFWLVMVIAWRDAPRTVLLASGVVFLLGLALLLWRMPHRRGDGGPDDADDDGAVV
jgi:hypothetical protein